MSARKNVGKTTTTAVPKRHRTEKSFHRRNPREIFNSYPNLYIYQIVFRSICNDQQKKEFNGYLRGLETWNR